MKNSIARRVIELDATRGVAMLAVCLSHAADLVQGRYYSELGTDLVALGLMATPTFLLLSGVICGYLAASMPLRLNTLRWRWLDRGLFLLIVAHLLLGITAATWAPWREVLFDSFYITDAAAVGLICAAAGLIRLRPGQLISAGLALVMTSFVSAHLFKPHSPSIYKLMVLLTGHVDSQRELDGYIVPVLPYLGLFMIGIAGGHQYSSLLMRGVPNRRIATRCLLIGGSCVLIALGMKAFWYMWQPQAEDWQLLFHDLAALRQKLPPGLAYILVFGGLGIMATGVLGWLTTSMATYRVVEGFATVGRASLVVYLLQYWLYYFPERALNVGTLHGVGFAGYILFTLILLWSAAWCWGRIGGNRFLTVGIWHWVQARREERLLLAPAAVLQSRHLTTK